MRAVFALILLAGAAIGIGYPWYVNNFSGTELGTWEAYDRQAGFKTFDAQLTDKDAPVRVLVDLTAAGAPAFDAGRAVLTLTVSSGGETVLADTMSFANASSPRQVSPQSTDKVFRAEAGIIDPTPAGAYTFTLGQGDADGFDIGRVDVVLRSDAGMLDARAQPLGFVLMAAGFIGFAMARRRKRGDPPSNPNSQPPSPRWGRDAGKR